MFKDLTPAERLIVAADFKPEGNGVDSVRTRVLALADQLVDSGVCIKVNSVLRMCGYGFISELHDRGLSVFADLKLFDIGETLATDGAMLRQLNPELLTVSCAAGSVALKRLKDELPDTEVLGVTVLTSLSSGESERMFGDSEGGAVYKFAEIAEQSDLDGVICAPKEVEGLRMIFGDQLSLNTPGIRPLWATVQGDDQNAQRVMTPLGAIRAGADRIVVGRPITQHTNPYGAVVQTIEEIASALS